MIATLRVLKIGIGLVVGAMTMFGANMKMTGVGNNGVLAGIYIGPYTALIDNVPTYVICDDFTADTYVNQTWTATQYALNDLANETILNQTRWGREEFTLDQYKQAAWLTMQLLNPPSVCASGHCAGDIQFAIWSLFDPGAANHLATYAPSHVDDVQNWQSRALKEFTSVDYSNVYIYTPQNVRGAPQEFIVVKTPEPTTVALLLVQFSLVGGLVWFVRRKTARS